MVAQTIGDHETSTDKANDDAEDTCCDGSMVRRHCNIERPRIEKGLNIDGSVVRRNYNIERPWIGD